MATEVPKVIGDNAETRRFLDAITRDLRALQTTVGGIAPAPPDAQYITLATNGTLSAERVLTAGSGISLTDNGAGNTLVVDNTLTTIQDGGSSGLSGASVTVTNIPAHTIMIIQIAGSSHNSGVNQFFQIELSANNGSSFSAPVQVNALVAAAVLQNFIIYVTSDAGNSAHLITGDNNNGGTDLTSGEINAVRMTYNGGSFDAGNYRIHVL